MLLLRLRLVFALCACTLPAGCAGVPDPPRVLTWNQPEFSLTHNSGGSLAGVAIHNASAIDDLHPLDGARIREAFHRGKLPIRGVILLRVLSPSENVLARLADLDWVLLLDDTETVRGTLDHPYLLPPGQPATIPVRFEFDLLDFLDGQFEEVVPLAFALAGAGGPHRTQIVATPSILTSQGAIRHTRPVRMERDG